VPLQDQVPLDVRDPGQGRDCGGMRAEDPQPKPTKWGLHLSAVDQGAPQPLGSPTASTTTGGAAAPVVDASGTEVETPLPTIVGMYRCSRFPP